MFKSYPQIKKGDIWERTTFWKWLSETGLKNLPFEEAFKIYLSFHAYDQEKHKLDKYQVKCHKACYEVYMYLTNGEK